MTLKIQFLTNQNSWIDKNKKDFVYNFFKKKSKKFNFVTSYKKLLKNFDILIILSYYKIIPEKYLKFSKNNLVVHESDLPKGKGFSPLYWQILNKKTKIIFSLFEATREMDAGKIYLKKEFYFPKHILFEEIKELQFKYAIELISWYLKKKKNNIFINPSKQRGKNSFYRQRFAKDSQVNIKKSILEQINKFRIANNSDYPVFFIYNKFKYFLKIEKEVL